MITKIVKRVLKSVPTKYSIEILLPGGLRVVHGTLEDGKSADIVLRMKSYKPLLRFIFMGGPGIGESYMHGEMDIIGKKAVRKFAEIGMMINQNRRTSFIAEIFRRTAWWMLRMRTSNATYRQAKINAMHHYNHNGKLFRILLGRTYGYTENYHHTGAEDLDQAQQDRFEYVAKKMLLKPGLSVVEVGSGWGFMSSLMAKKYGVSVVNYGIVPEQNRVMQEMIKEEGVSNLVTVVEKDHRELVNEPGKYDRYVSLGVYEHAGSQFQEDWIRSIAACLKEGGVGVISFLGFASQKRNSYFINKHIFPGTDTSSLAQALLWMEKYDLHALDIENLWWHYRRAVEMWSDNLTKHWDEIKRIDPKEFDEKFMRSWHLYLEGSESMFENHTWGCNVFHITFTKGKQKDYYPITRDFLYKEESRK